MDEREDEKAALDRARTLPLNEDGSLNIAGFHLRSADHRRFAVELIREICIAILPSPEQVIKLRSEQQKEKQQQQQQQDEDTSSGGGNDSFSHGSFGTTMQSTNSAFTSEYALSSSDEHIRVRTRTVKLASVTHHADNLDDACEQLRPFISQLLLFPECAEEIRKSLPDIFVKFVNAAVTSSDAQLIVQVFVRWLSSLTLRPLASMCLDSCDAILHIKALARRMRPSSAGGIIVPVEIANMISLDIVNHLEDESAWYPSARLCLAKLYLELYDDEDHIKCVIAMLETDNNVHVRQTAVQELTKWLKSSTEDSNLVERGKMCLAAMEHLATEHDNRENCDPFADNNNNNKSNAAASSGSSCHVLYGGRPHTMWFSCDNLRYACIPLVIAVCEKIHIAGKQDNASGLHLLRQATDFAVQFAVDPSWRVRYQIAKVVNEFTEYPACNTAKWVDAATTLTTDAEPAVRTAIAQRAADIFMSGVSAASFASLGAALHDQHHPTAAEDDNDLAERTLPIMLNLARDPEAVVRGAVVNSFFNAWNKFSDHAHSFDAECLQVYHSLLSDPDEHVRIVTLESLDILQDLMRRKDVLQEAEAAIMAAVPNAKELERRKSISALPSLDAMQALFSKMQQPAEEQVNMEGDDTNNHDEGNVAVSNNMNIGAFSNDLLLNSGDNNNPEVVVDQQPTSSTDSTTGVSDNDVLCGGFDNNAMNMMMGNNNGSGGGLAAFAAEAAAAADAAAGSQQQQPATTASTTDEQQQEEASSSSPSTTAVAAASASPPPPHRNDFDAFHAGNWHVRKLASEKMPLLARYTPSGDFQSSRLFTCLRELISDPTAAVREHTAGVALPAIALHYGPEFALRVTKEWVLPMVSDSQYMKRRSAFSALSGIVTGVCQQQQVDEAYAMCVSELRELVGESLHRLRHDAVSLVREAVEKTMQTNTVVRELIQK